MCALAVPPISYICCHHIFSNSCFSLSLLPLPPLHHEHAWLKGTTLSPSPLLLQLHFLRSIIIFNFDASCNGLRKDDVEKLQAATYLLHRFRLGPPVQVRFITEQV